MPDDSLKSTSNPLEILVPGVPRSPATLLLDGSDGLKLLATSTKDLVLAFAAWPKYLELTLQGDGAGQVFTLAWRSPIPTATACVKWEPDIDGYAIEVPAVDVPALPQWVRSGSLYSASSQQNGPTTVFRPRREGPK
jgi:hypothetical protein